MNLSKEWLLANGVAPETLDRALAGAPRADEDMARMLEGWPVEPPAKGKRKPAHVKGQMNQTEDRFHNLLLEGRWIAPVLRWEFEVATLTIAPDMTFLPDFRIERQDGSIDYVDVKGKHVWDDAICKIKAAAVVFPTARFYIAQLRAGEWRVRHVGVPNRKRYVITA